MFFSHSLIYFVFLLLFTLVEGGMPRVFVSDTCFEGPEWYQILKIHLVVASNAIKCMLMDVIFDETRVRTCRHRIYKRNLVSVKRKLNLKPTILATVFSFSEGGNYRDSFHGNEQNGSVYK